MWLWAKAAREAQGLGRLELQVQAWQPSEPPAGDAAPANLALVTSALTLSVPLHSPHLSQLWGWLTQPLEMVAEKLSDEFIYSSCSMGCLFGGGCGAWILFPPFSSGRNQLMLEGLGECGKEQRTMKQGHAGLYSEDPGVVPGGLRGNWGWLLLARGVRGGWDSRVWASGLPAQPFFVLGSLGLLRTEHLVLVTSGKKGYLGTLNLLGMRPPSACRSKCSKKRECCRAGVRVCMGGNRRSPCPRASPWPRL